MILKLKSNSELIKGILVIITIDTFYQLYRSNLNLLICEKTLLSGGGKKNSIHFHLHHVDV